MFKVNNKEYMSHLALVFLLLTLSRKIRLGKRCLGPYQTPMMELFYNNSSRLLVINPLIHVPKWSDTLYKSCK